MEYEFFRIGFYIIVVLIVVFAILFLIKAITGLWTGEITITYSELIQGIKELPFLASGVMSNYILPIRLVAKILVFSFMVIIFLIISVAIILSGVWLKRSFWQNYKKDT